MMRGIVLLAVASALACGCTSTPLQPNSREVRRPERLVPIGIVHTERTTDIVTVLENVEYALFPNKSAAQIPPQPQSAILPVSAPRPNIDFAPLAHNTPRMTLNRRTQQCVPSK